MTFVNPILRIFAKRSVMPAPHKVCKLQKCKLDLLFLTKCKTYDVIPKIILFKPYCISLHSQQLYKFWTIDLLDHEFTNKKLQNYCLHNILHETEATVKQSFSAMDTFLDNQTIGRI